MLASPAPKSVAKSIVKSLAMNGTLQNHGDCAELESRNTKSVAGKLVHSYFE